MNHILTKTIFLLEESHPYSRCLSPAVTCRLFYLHCVLEGGDTAVLPFGRERTLTLKQDKRGGIVKSWHSLSAEGVWEEGPGDRGGRADWAAAGSGSAWLQIPASSFHLPGPRYSNSRGDSSHLRRQL